MKGGGNRQQIYPRQNQEKLISFSYQFNFGKPELKPEKSWKKKGKVGKGWASGVQLVNLSTVGIFQQLSKTISIVGKYSHGSIKDALSMQQQQQHQ